MSETAFSQVMSHTETAWCNPYKLPFSAVSPLCDLILPAEQIRDAGIRLQRFAPFLAKVFPETAPAGGIIESDLREIPCMAEKLAALSGSAIPGRLFLKPDSHLPIAGSVKARGGIYEVLKHAEDLALAAGLLSYGDDYTKLTDMRDFFGRYTVQVGSTGNLGMSIGIMGAALGFRVKVHMSADARQWKKDLLRSRGVEVLEYTEDYSAAVAQGRKLSDEDPMSYFVDDEKSMDLFLGYAVAADRLQKQLNAKGITVDSTHPLLVYIPAGVGGAPGGIAYGLRQLFGDNVHCFFAEPVECPSVLLGIASRKFENVRVQDYGLSGKTEADGLACASPSGFVTRIMTPHLAGVFTVQDSMLYKYLRLLYASEGMEIEPSACAAFAGPAGLLRYPDTAAYCRENGLTDAVLENAVQIVWATGGSLVPEDIRKQYRETVL
ncbi:MAG: D-serine ammonia-lyase [Ruminococcaceae bacterium]|nr:D-serine ammonia-lyase [Oscillospiraceae bacterium]